MNSTYLIIFAVAIVIAVIIIHNTIISAYNRVKQAWSDVLTHERQKEKILPRLEQLAREYKDYESELMRGVTELRTALSPLKAKDTNNIDTSVVADVDRATKVVSNGLMAVFEAYPDLKASETYRGLMNEVTEQEMNVAAAIKIYNANVNDFNTLVEIFPNNIVNKCITRKVRVDEFSDTQASSTFDRSLF